MRLAIVHYHLKKGGVTKVIATALEALGNDFGEVVVFSSSMPEEPLPCRCVIVPELAYDIVSSPEKVNVLHACLMDAALDAFGAMPDLWHVHNHCLGKNVNFPAAFRRILDKGACALLQIHDFAEDGRPANYAAQRKAFEQEGESAYNDALYPLGQQIGYAVLNGRDRDILLRAGVPENRLFWLPNAVTVPPAPAEVELASAPEKPLILYPTRAIRRKNLGELLLLALVYPDYRWGTTLSPKNPEWADIYNNWVHFAAQLNLSIEFGLGEKPGNTFEGLVREAHAMVTTSVGEGFGLAFLEPWLFGKPLCGRNLPEITNDFRDNGISLPDLYDEWPVSCELFDTKTLRERFYKTVKGMFAAYGRTISVDAMAAAFLDKFNDGACDFGFLDEEAQAQVLMSLSMNPHLIPDVRPLAMESLDQSILSDNVVEINVTYGLPAYASKLKGIYDRLRNSVPTNPRALDASRVLDEFLDLKRFTFLRT